MKSPEISGDSGSEDSTSSDASASKALLSPPAPSPITRCRLTRRCAQCPLPASLELAGRFSSGSLVLDEGERSAAGSSCRLPQREREGRGQAGKADSPRWLCSLEPRRVTRMLARTQGARPCDSGGNYSHCQERLTLQISSVLYF